ncbi:MAG TPA: hypothetical protein VG992_01530 [Candidatus Saccharimonadales bacterium]|nr:hypothetical protein [Candidatus Saccharimonadales bacterium]
MSSYSPAEEAPLAPLEAQPVTQELWKQIDNWREITEIRSELFSNVGEVTLLHYRFGQAARVSPNGPEPGYEHVTSYDPVLIFRKLSRTKGATLRGFRNRT